MAQKAKFKLLSETVSHDRGTNSTLNYNVELTDADNDVSNYVVTDYYNASKTEIVETNVVKYEDEGEYIDIDSPLGKKILTFVNG